MVPVGRGKCDFQVLDLLGRYQAGEILELVDVGAANMSDLARAEHGLAGLVALLEEGRNVGGVGAENAHVEVGDFLESVQTREESTPEH